MLYAESEWFKKVLNKYIERDRAIVLNIGSSTKEFRETEQPYVQENVFDVLATKNATVLNVDLKQEAGVDLVGDVTDAEFIKKLYGITPNAIICSNLLEHLTIRELFCNSLIKIMNKDTYLIVSVPYSFPYHPDPIDTLYRPSPQDLKVSFKELEIIESKIVQCGTFFNFIHKNVPLKLKVKYRVFALIRLLLPFYKSDTWKDNLWNFKSISATCVVFKLKGI